MATILSHPLVVGYGFTFCACFHFDFRDSSKDQDSW